MKAVINVVLFSGWCKCCLSWPKNRRTVVASENTLVAVRLRIRNCHSWQVPVKLALVERDWNMWLCMEVLHLQVATHIEVASFIFACDLGQLLWYWQNLGLFILCVLNYFLVCACACACLPVCLCAVRTQLFTGSERCLCGAVFFQAWKQGAPQRWLSRETSFHCFVSAVLCTSQSEPWGGNIPFHSRSHWSAGTTVAGTLCSGSYAKTELWPSGGGWGEVGLGRDLRSYLSLVHSPGANVCKRRLLRLTCLNIPKNFFSFFFFSYQMFWLLSVAACRNTGSG